MGIFSDILLTVDFDRTLTAPDSTIPERNLEAIRYFTENGGAFTVNTGRSIPMCHTIWDIPVNVPLLLYNGSAACDSRTRELSLCRPIELPRREVLEHLQSRYPKLTVEVQGVDAHYILRKDTGWEAYCDNNRCPWAYKEPDEIPGPFLKFSIYGEIRDVTVDHLFHGSAEEIRRLDEVQALITKLYGDQVVAFRAGPRIIDIHAKGISKARAAKELQAQLGRKILV